MQRNRIRIGAALFNADHGRLAEEVTRLDSAGIDFVHLDVYDGHFALNLGFPPETISALRPRTKLPFEVHLGAIDPLRFVPQLAKAGVDLVIIHIESLSMTHEAISQARTNNVKVGLAFTLGTPLERLEPVIKSVDAVLLLSRVIGEGTQNEPFNPVVLSRVRRVREMAQAADAEVDVQVVGGIKPENIPDLVSAGASSLGFGRSLYQVPDMAKEVGKIRALTQRP